MDWWNQFISGASAFFDKPVVITITAILTTAAPFFAFLSKTSFGKKAIRDLHSLYDLSVSRADATLKKVEEIKELAENKYDNFTKDCKQQVTYLVSVVQYYEESVFSILEEVPNAKVQTKLLQFKSEYQEKKKEISNKVGLLYQDYEVMESKIRKEYDEKFKMLEEQFNNFKLEMKGHSENGGERNDDNSAIEEI